MSDWLERTALLIGDEGVATLKNKHILVVGLGGVGSYAAETLVRAGIGHITIIDGDKVDSTNKNRQLQALDSTVGHNKADVLKNRFLDINPQLCVTSYDQFMEPDAMHQHLLHHKYDFVLDCIDSIQPKLAFILTTRRLKIQSISSMGAGGKMDPSKIAVADISKTSECKFAAQIKKDLKKKGVDDNVLTVYCKEIQPKHSLAMTDGARYKKSFYGTISYMPAMMGMTMAAEVIQWLLRGSK